MKRIAHSSIALALIPAAAVGGYLAGARGIALPGLGTALEAAGTIAEGAAQSGPIIYYRDPDGRPNYSLTPRETGDGRAFRAALASEDVSFDERPPATTAGGSDGPRILYYRNPMGLPDTSPVPKKDSMGMDYIPVYEGEASDGSVVQLTPGKIQRTGVRSEIVTRRVVQQSMRLPGIVRLDERRIAVVSTRTDAFVEEVFDVTTGDTVKQGQPLLRLYSPEMVAAGAQYLSELQSGVQRANSGARLRLTNLAIPENAIAEIEDRREVPVSITWTAPMDGVVLERNVSDGMKMESGELLFRLADTSVVWVVADVPEIEIAGIRIGATAAVRVRSLPGRIFTGQISRIYPEVAAATRTVKVRVELANPDGSLLPDMYAEVDVTIGNEGPALVVPDDALIDTGTRQLVVLDRGEGRFEPRPVTPGRRGDGYVEILDGLAEGDRVVVAANFLIDAESNLKAALQSLTPPEPAP